jgi:hypothetical protein
VQAIDAAVYSRWRPRLIFADFSHTIDALERNVEMRLNQTRMLLPIAAR